MVSDPSGTAAVWMSGSEAGSASITPIRAMSTSTVPTETGNLFISASDSASVVVVRRFNSPDCADFCAASGGPLERRVRHGAAIELTSHY